MLLKITVPVVLILCMCHDMRNFLGSEIHQREREKATDAVAQEHFRIASKNVRGKSHLESKWADINTHRKSIRIGVYGIRYTQFKYETNTHSSTYRTINLVFQTNQKSLPRILSIPTYAYNIEFIRLNCNPNTNKINGLFDSCSYYNSISQLDQDSIEFQAFRCYSGDTYQL